MSQIKKYRQYLIAEAMIMREVRELVMKIFVGELWPQGVHVGQAEQVVIWIAFVALSQKVEQWLSANEPIYRGLRHWWFASKILRAATQCGGHLHVIDGVRGLVTGEK